MPKLDHQSALDFWKNYQDTLIYRVVCFMETKEDWTLDGHPELESSIEKLGIALDEVKKFELGKQEQFVAMFAHIKSSRILRTLQAIDTIDPGSASKLLMFAEEKSAANHPLAGLFLRRNIIFERLRLLSRVFSPQRVEMVLRSMEQEHV